MSLKNTRALIIFGLTLQHELGHIFNLHIDVLDAPIIEDFRLGIR